MDEISIEYAELTELYSYITSEAFEKHIAAKVRGELEKLKPAYKCESLREMATLKGKAKAYEQVLNFIDRQAMAERIIYLKGEIEKSDRGA